MSPSTITLLFLLFAVIMFVLEKIPLGVTSMIVCIGLVVTGVLDVKTAFAGFIDSNVILFVSMFIVGGALFETGMANKIGGIVTKFAKTERMLIIAIKHRYSSSSDSGSNRYRSKIWIQEIPSSDATGICGCYGRQSFSDRSTWKSDRTECTSGNRYEVRIFRICYRWFTDSDRRNFILCDHRVQTSSKS